MNKFGMAVVGILGVAVIATAGLESKYATGTSSAAVMFGPNVSARTLVKSIYATTDKAAGAVAIYARQSKVAVTNNPVSGATTVLVDNSSSTISNSDVVVYVHANGTCDKTTVSTAAATSLILAAGISATGTVYDAVYKINQQGYMLVGTSGTTTGTPAVLNTAGDVFASPGDSPVWISVDGTSNSAVTATVDK